jgi:hypothetical protein
MVVCAQSHSGQAIACSVLDRFKRGCIKAEAGMQQSYVSSHAWQPLAPVPAFAFGPLGAPAQLLMHVHMAGAEEALLPGSVSASTHRPHAREGCCQGCCDRCCNRYACDACCRMDRATGDTGCLRLSLCLASSGEACGAVCAGLCQGLVHP